LDAAAGEEVGVVGDPDCAAGAARAGGDHQRERRAPLQGGGLPWGGAGAAGHPGGEGGGVGAGGGAGAVWRAHTPESCQLQTAPVAGGGGSLPRTPYQWKGGGPEPPVAERDRFKNVPTSPVPRLQTPLAQASPTVSIASG